MNISDIAKKFYEQELAESGGEWTEYGARAWAFVFRQLTPAELAAVESLPVTYFFEDNSEAPIWEKVQDLLNFWEEWSYGELCESLAKVCDERNSPLGQSPVWEWMLQHIAFSREDYDFCNLLLAKGDEELTYTFFQGTSYGDLPSDPRAAEFKEIKPGYDPFPFYARLDAAHTLWEAAAQSRGDDWVKSL